MFKKTDGRRNVEVSNIEQEDSEKLPRLALFPLAVPGDGLSPAVPLAVRPRHAFLADPAALAVGVDGAAEDVAPLAVLAVPAEVPTVLTLARSSVARAHRACRDLVVQLEVAVVGAGVGGEDEEEDREQGQEVGPGGHCDKTVSNLYYLVWFGIKFSTDATLSTWKQLNKGPYKPQLINPAVISALI